MEKNMPNSVRHNDMRSARRTIIWTGAPLSTSLTALDDLQQCETSLDDSNHLQPRIRSFLSSKPPSIIPSTTPNQTSSHLAAWRTFRAAADQLHTGFSQRRWLLEHSPQNFNSRQDPDVEYTTPSRVDTQVSYLSVSSGLTSQSLDTTILAELQASQDEDETNISDYLDQSFALHHEETPMKAPAQAETSVCMWPYKTIAQLPDHTKIPSRSIVECPAPLVSILAVVTSVSPPKEVTIRRTGRRARLYEVMIGDESAAGFAVTIWQSTSIVRDAKRPDKKAQINFAERPSELQPGMIVECRNIALTKFRERVYGQSQGGFRQSNPRRTQIQCICSAKSRSTRTEPRLDNRTRHKVSQLRAWWRDFVALEASPNPPLNTDGPARVHKKAQTLPPDESFFQSI